MIACDWQPRQHHQSPIGDSSSQPPSNTLEPTSGEVDTLNERIEPGAIIHGHLERYRIEAVLQESLYGSVYSACGLESDSAVAVKVLLKRGIEAREKNRELPETPLAEVFFSPFLKGHSHMFTLREVFETATHHLVVSDRAEAEDLLELLKSNSSGLPELFTRVFMRQAAEALQFCHSQNIALQDFSLENCLLFLRNGKYLVKVCDPGQAVVFQRTPNGEEKTVSYSGCVGKRFRPPEIFTKEPYIPSKVDSWCLGWSTFYLLFAVAIFESAYPFDEDPRWQKFKDGKLVDLLAELGVLSRFSPMAKNFVTRLLHEDPRMRMSICESLLHPFLADVKGKTVGVMHLPPPERARKDAKSSMSSDQQEKSSNEKLRMIKRRCPMVPEKYMTEYLPLYCMLDKPSGSLLTQLVRSSKNLRIALREKNIKRNSRALAVRAAGSEETKPVREETAESVERKSASSNVKDTQRRQRSEEKIMYKSTVQNCPNKIPILSAAQKSPYNSLKSAMQRPGMPASSVRPRAPAIRKDPPQVAGRSEGQIGCERALPTSWGKLAGSPLYSMRGYSPTAVPTDQAGTTSSFPACTDSSTTIQHAVHSLQCTSTKEPTSGAMGASTLRGNNEPRLSPHHVSPPDRPGIMAASKERLKTAAGSALIERGSARKSLNNSLLGQLRGSKLYPRQQAAESQERYALRPKAPHVSVGSVRSHMESPSRIAKVPQAPTSPLSDPSLASVSPTNSSSLTAGSPATGRHSTAVSKDSTMVLKRTPAAEPSLEAQEMVLSRPSVATVHQTHVTTSKTGSQTSIQSPHRFQENKTTVDRMKPHVKTVTGTSLAQLHGTNGYSIRLPPEPENPSVQHYRSRFPETQVDRKSPPNTQTVPGLPQYYYLAAGSTVLPVTSRVIRRNVIDSPDNSVDMSHMLRERSSVYSSLSQASPQRSGVSLHSRRFPVDLTRKDVERPTVDVNNHNGQQKVTEREPVLEDRLTKRRTPATLTMPSCSLMRIDRST